MSEDGSPDTGAVVVTFALPDESRSFVAALTGIRTSHRGRPPALPTIMGRSGDELVAVVHTGMGDTAAGRARLQETLATAGNLRGVISAGYAGGLAARLRVGDLVLGENFSDARLAASARRLLRDEGLHAGAITTQKQVAATAAAKSALAAGTGALAVDMETGWIAEVCAEAGMPMLALRVVSDAAGQDFPVPSRILFDAVRQRPRYVALPAWLLAHPGRIAPFVGFVRGLGPARERLARALRLLVARL